MSRRLLEEHINFEQEEKEIQIRGEIITTSPSRSGSQILMLVTSLAFGAGCKVEFVGISNKNVFLILKNKESSSLI